MKLLHKCIIFLVSTIIFILSLILIEIKLRGAEINFIRPIRIEISPNASDWREFHMFTDKDFIPDPYLFWKLRPGGLVNSKGFIGQDFNVIKPAGVFRVFCLGDSNTQGSRETSYPGELRRLIQESPMSHMKFEIINAGASGYTSLQGVRLFSEILKYKPDLVIICFGWNDSCLTNQGADNNFQPATKHILRLERFLYQFKIYQFLKYIAVKIKYRLSRLRNTVNYSSRVNLEDYEENLAEMFRIAKDNKINILFMTRPCIFGVEPGMVSFIENTRKYNTAMRVLTSRLRIDLIDAESLCLEKPQYFIDSCHFNRRGNRFLAEKIYGYLERHFQK